MKKKIGCLIIHGFGGAYHEINTLANTLKYNDYIIACPSLAGHTGLRKDLKNIHRKEWIASAEKGLQLLLDTCDVVFIVGFSMGGLIGLELSTRYAVSGVVTLNTPIYYWNFKQIFLNVFSDIKHHDPVHLRHYFSSALKFPLNAMRQFQLLLNDVKKVLQKVRCPLLIIQGTDDDTVRTKSARYIYDHVFSKNKFIIPVHPSGHLILKSPSALIVCQQIHSFMKQSSTTSL